MGTNETMERYHEKFTFVFGYLSMMGLALSLIFTSILLVSYDEIDNVDRMIMYSIGFIGISMLAVAISVGMTIYHNNRKEYYSRK